MCITAYLYLYTFTAAKGYAMSSKHLAQLRNYDALLAMIKFSLNSEPNLKFLTYWSMQDQIYSLQKCTLYLSHHQPISEF